MPRSAFPQRRGDALQQLVIDSHVRLDVDGFDLEDAVFSMRLRVETPDQRAPVQDGQREISVEPFGRGRVAFETVVEAEHAARPCAIPHQRVERRKQRGQFGLYVAQQRKSLEAMMRVIRGDGAIFYNHKWRVQDGLLQDRHDIVKDFPVRQIIIWKRKGGLNFNPGYFLPTYEVIYLICKPNFKLAPGANKQGDVWNIPQDKNNPHPAPFPVELAQQCIRSTTGQIILDPQMGSGSTAIAAEALGRDWIGMDISPEYCKLANERILAHRGLFRKNE